jgi:CheY-like chemotaxis protein
VTVAADGAGAYACFERGTFDLVLMDIQMPEVDGLQATGMIRREEHRRGTGRTPILALTAHAARQQHEQCMAAGMDGVITKPVNRGALVRAIADALDLDTAKNQPQSRLFVQKTT